jgi:hypothetical protein
MICETCGEGSESEGRSVFETADGDIVCTACRHPTVA